MVESKYFVTYEELLDYLDTKTGFSPPRIIEGKHKFLSKFNRWFMNFEDVQSEAANWRCIFPDPKLNISYPYPIDEVTVACSFNDNPNAYSDAQRILSEYHLDTSLSKRQTMTLSGGELLLLSFAKAKGLKDITDTIFICTPTQWLHKSKYFLLDNLIREYSDGGKNVYIFMLEGEQLNQAEGCQSVDNLQYKRPKIDRLPWSICIKDLSKTFEAQVFPKESPAKTLRYLPLEFNKELQSPTLVIGDNGVGKSVFVKMLSNIYQPTTGKLAVRCLGNEGFARVLMQDSLDQLFGETIDEHLKRVFKFDKGKGGLSKNLYEEMLNELRLAIKDNPKLRSAKLAASNVDFIETILQVKFALIAERLASRPPLLILDEPDWCLSKPLTQIFISIVVTTAHKIHVPILIITHLSSWYTGLIHSIIDLKRQGDSSEIILEEQIIKDNE